MGIDTLKHQSPVRYLCIVLAVVTFAIYANTLRNGYVLDDDMVLSNNSIVKQGVKALPTIFSTPRSMGADVFYTNDFYRPLSMAMFAVEVQLFGLSPMVGHLFNILAFVGCVLLLFLFLDRLLGGNKTAVAFIAALLFAVHPIHTEVAANIKSRDELLCFFFGFMALLLFLRYMKEGRVAHLLWGMVVFFLAYLSKETVIAFVAVVPVLFFFYKNESRKRAVMITGGVVLVTGAFLLIRHSILAKYHADDNTVPFIQNALAEAPDAATRLATEMLVLGKYIGLLFVPYPLVCNYSFNSIPFASFGDLWVIVSCLVHVGLLVVGARLFLRKKDDPWAFAIFFYFATLFLFSNLSFLTGAQMAERFLFFPSVGFCLLIALAIDKWPIGPNPVMPAALKSPKVLAVLVPVVLTYCALTVNRNAEWRSSYTLYSADVERSPEDSRLYMWLSYDISRNLFAAETDTTKQHELNKQSIGYLLKSLAIYPRNDESHADLGWIYMREGKYDSAYYHDKMALEINPKNAAACADLGNLYFQAGKYPEALRLLRRAVAIEPRSKMAYVTMANCYMQTRQYDSAIENSRRALVADAAYADAHQAIGNAFLRLQRFDSAEEHFKQVVALKPNYAMAVNNLGVTYLDSKQFSKAITQFQKVIAIDPRYLNAYSNLARAYYYTHDYNAAIDAINKVRRLDPRNTADLPIMALCYQQLGNMALAQKYEALAQQAFPDFKLP